MPTLDESATQPQPSSPPASGEAALPAAKPYVGSGFWIRVLARVIDLIVHYVVTFFAGLLIVIIAGVIAAVGGVSPTVLSHKLQSFSLLSYVLVILGYILYHTLCEGLHGATMGKLICGLVVIKENGSPCSLGAAFGRSLAFLIDSFFFGFVAAAAMSSPQRQRLGDIWLHTFVVKRKDLQLTQLRSGGTFAVVFLGAVMLDGFLALLGQLLKLLG
jgi:uncharacterized RDD family membrane protein YckC